MGKQNVQAEKVYLSAEYGISKQQTFDIHKNKEKIIKFANILETSKGLKWKLLKEQLDKALYTCTGIHNGQWRCLRYFIPNDL